MLELLFDAALFCAIVLGVAYCVKRLLNLDKKREEIKKGEK